MKKRYSILLLFFATSIASWKSFETNKQQLRFKQKLSEAASYCQTNKFNTDFCILIDLSLHSGKNRVFLCDLKKDTIISSALCAHGCGSNPWGETTTKEKPIFSNTPDSHCSSLGKFKIGKRGYSNWGINVNYLLHGLESSNSNALKREIVLHSWEEVAEKEVYPKGTPEGWGCPAVANGFMRIIDPKLKASEKSVLLWMFN
jgi:hypothetical protein